MKIKIRKMVHGYIKYEGREWNVDVLKESKMVWMTQ